MSLKASKWAKYIIQWRRETLKANLSVRFLLFGKSSKVTIMMGHLGFPGLMKVFFMDYESQKTMKKLIVNVMKKLTFKTMSKIAAFVMPCCWEIPHYQQFFSPFLSESL